MRVAPSATRSAFIALGSLPVQDVQLTSFTSASSTATESRMRRSTRSFPVATPAISSTQRQPRSKSSPKQQTGSIVRSPRLPISAVCDSPSKPAAVPNRENRISPASCAVWTFRPLGSHNASTNIIVVTPVVVTRTPIYELVDQDALAIEELAEMASQSSLAVDLASQLRDMQLSHKPRRANCMNSKTQAKTKLVSEKDLTFQTSSMNLSKSRIHKQKRRDRKAPAAWAGKTLKPSLRSPPAVRGTKRHVHSSPGTIALKKSGSPCPGDKYQGENQGLETPGKTHDHKAYPETSPLLGRRQVSLWNIFDSPMGNDPFRDENSMEMDVE